VWELWGVKLLCFQVCLYYFILPICYFICLFLSLFIYKMGIYVYNTSEGCCYTCECVVKYTPWYVLIHGTYSFQGELVRCMLNTLEWTDPHLNPSLANHWLVDLEYLPLALALSPSNCPHFDYSDLSVSPILFMVCIWYFLWLEFSLLIIIIPVMAISVLPDQDQVQGISLRALYACLADHL
jgi:hypothetical protein